MKNRHPIEELLSYAFLLFPLGRMKRKILHMNIDVTYRCNLKCRHCYFLKENYKKELPDKEFLGKIREYNEKYKPLYCSWVGGEPLLRKELIKRGMKYFPNNWIITNGTIPLPEWYNCSFIVSVDGTKGNHESLRGKGTYDKIQKNIASSNARIWLNTVITSENHTKIEDFVNEWSQTGVRGISPFFYSPMKKNDPLAVSSEKRDEIIERLKKLVDEYGDFMVITKDVLDRMKSDNFRKYTGNSCLVRKTSICLDPMGEPKDPCLFRGVICNECGCSFPHNLHSFFSRERKVIKSGILLTDKWNMKQLSVLKEKFF